MNFLHTPATTRRRPGALAAGTLAALLLSACAHLAPQPPQAPPPPEVALAPQPAMVSATSVASPAAPPVDAAMAVLAYADKVRALPAPELATELTTLNHSSEPAEQLKLALLLHQQHQLHNQRPSAELGRAQELVAQVLSADTASAKPLHPLARLLAARYADQRRWDEQAERQNQQLRDLQRRLDQTTERLEALKAIERSLSSRPASPPLATPANGSRPSPNANPGNKP